MTKAHIKDCILCGNANAEIYISHNKFDIIHCKVCGLYYQQTKGEIKSRQDIYDNIYGERPREFKNRWHLNKRNNQYCHDISIFQKKPGHLLDIGCSYGFLMEYFIKKGWKATGIDISVNAITYAKSRGLNCHNVGIENFKSENKFDVIIMNHVLEHLESPLQSLKIIKNWLAPHGIIYIRVPNIENRVFMPRYQSFISCLKPFEHLFYFSKSTLKALLEKAGLRVYLKTESRITLGDVINCYVRLHFVLKNFWQVLNYKLTAERKKEYLFAKRLYTQIVSVLGIIPVGPRNKEIVAIASL